MGGMIDKGKQNVLGILMNAVDYEAAVEFVIGAARERRGAAISALAVHGLMTGVSDSEQKYRLNHFDLLVPDGHPVRWALNFMYGTALPDRVYGPNLTLKVCQRAADERLPVYFYGSTPNVLAGMKRFLLSRFPALSIAGMEPSRFRCLNEAEKSDLVERIRISGAAITFAGLGCPRQEVWAYEFREALSMPVLAVGAAFPFFAGEVPQAPRWMQDRGLEWLFRLTAEPKRLWRRYILLNPAYLTLLALQVMHLSRPSTDGISPRQELLYG
jgi:N-acetylglucosaminyldiphosphoundecaprenol N-acetyl-beta-D-mannosaminyltransferase